MSIQRISVGAGGVQANGGSTVGSAPSMSTDNRYVVFDSSASNLVAGDANGVMDVFILDRTTGTISLASTASDGTRGSGASFDGVISADGHYLVFKTQATNIGGDSDTHVVRKNLVTGEIIVAGIGRPVSDNTDDPSISADGRYVAFTTSGLGGDNLRFDALTGQTLAANAFPNGTVASGISTASVSLSGDGRYAAFYSDVQFTSGDTGGFFPGGVPSYDIFIKDLTTGTIERISNSIVNPGLHANNASHNSEFSTDGRYVVYHTYASDIVSGDTNGIGDVVRYDRVTRLNEVVSTTANGAFATGPGPGSYAPEISANGRYVVFQSTATDLVPGDTNGHMDLFVKDMTSGAIKLVSAAADGTLANADSSFATISQDGRFVTFTSGASNLVAGDTNGAADVFIVDLADSGFWQGVEQVGGDVVVNTSTTGDQHIPWVTALDNDYFVVTWTDVAAGLRKGQLFDEDGAKTGGEFAIMPAANGFDSGQLKLSNGSVLVYAQSTPGSQFGQIIDASGHLLGSAVQKLDGAFGGSYTATSIDGSFAIFSLVSGGSGVQLYDPTGGKVGAEFNFSDGGLPKNIFALAGGGYALVYKDTSGGLSVRQIDGAGAPIGSAEKISSGISDALTYDDFYNTRLPDGRMFVAWSQDGKILGRFLDSAGHPEAATLIVDQPVSGSPAYPHVVVTAVGNIAVSWSIGSTVDAVLLDAGGTQISDKVVLTSSVAVPWVVYPTALPDGSVLYNWRGLDGSQEGALARLLTADGKLGSSEIVLNDVTQGNQLGDGHVAVNSNGVLLSVFNDYAGTDGSGAGVLAQVLELTGSSAAIPPNHAPTDITLTTPDVANNASPGTVLGTLVATDADGSDTHFFSLLSDPSGLFEISGNALRLKAGASLDFETGGQYVIHVRTVDGRGGSFEKDLIIDLADVAPAFIGSSAAETRSGTSLDDVIYARAGNDTVAGGDGDDSIFGEAGNDNLTGGAGTDVLAGGAGNDTYVLGADDEGDVLVEAAGEGTDTVQLAVGFSAPGFTLADNIENVVVQSIGGAAVTGNVLANLMTGGLGGDTLDGSTGNDTLVGGAGNDFYVVDAAGDRVTEATAGGTDEIETTLSGYSLAALANVENLTYTGVVDFSGTGNASANVLTGAVGSDTLNGGTGNDTLAGNDGADSLVGGLGADSMAGADGGDTYVVDNAGDIVDEAGGDGAIDVVQSAVSFTLGQNVEYLTLTGGAALSGTGNELANSITGNAGANLLTGGDGDDTLSGGAGNDTYVIGAYDAADMIVEATGGGTDTVRLASAFLDPSYVLQANVEKIVVEGSDGRSITGNELANSMTGGAGDDTLDGGIGNDTLVGGAGDDVFIVDAVGDRVTELAGGGSDEIQTSLSTYSISSLANVESLTFTGAGSFTGTGNAGANTITGGSGDDLLSGGAGADALVGGDGADTYVVDNADDVVVDTGADGAIDLVRSSVSYTLASGIERIELTGASAISATGNAGDNLLTGNTGANLLDGGAGVDTMIGGAGNDVYLVDNLGDVVTEVAAQGTDTVLTTLSAYSLTAAPEVENLIYAGASGFAGTGNVLNNVLTGNAGNDTLDGGLGNDTLTGGGGADILDGGQGKDIMRGGAGDDSYVIDTLGETVSESLGEGVDTVTSSVSFALGANVENLILSGSAAAGTGNGLDNLIVGTSGINTISGGAGADTLIGNGGADSLLGGAGNDQIHVSGADVRKVDGGADQDTLVLDGAVYLDLTAIANTAFTGIEAIDITGGAGIDNTLRLAVDDVRDMSTTQLAAFLGLPLAKLNDTIVVQGDAGDSVVLSPGLGAFAAGSWQAAGSGSVAGQDYALYNFKVGSTVQGSIAIDSDIFVLL